MKNSFVNSTSGFARRPRWRARLFGLFGYVVLATAVGVSTALLTNPRPDPDQGLYIVIVLIAGLALSAATRPFFRSLGVRPEHPRSVLMPAALIVGSWLTLVCLAQMALSGWRPSIAAVISGLVFGLALFALWLEKTPSTERARLAGILLYVASLITAIAAVASVLPPSTLWVISAVIPAWQARRLAGQNHVQSAFAMLNTAIRMFAWVLVVGLAVPALIQFR